MNKNVGSSRQYATLVKVLDSLRREAPPGDKLYIPNPGNSDAVMQARSRALLHLFLKARFGVADFDGRIGFITDGPNDGGIDAFYIDRINKKIYLLQSKFRANAGNFVAKNMSADDLLRMDVKNILKGATKDENGFQFNEQIRKTLQKQIKALPDVGNYSTQVVLLGNTKSFTPTELKKLVDGYQVEQYHHERIFRDLLFPVIHGTYFTDPDLRIEISLANLRGGDGHLDYDVKTKQQKANIKLLFVPTREIGRILHTYKNSILTFNPRSFLELDKNPVNQDIAESIESGDGNEFALFNNGITIISDGTKISSDTAKQATAQVVLRNPQLVNGGQTAYTLGRIYQKCLTNNDFSVFKGKEVLLRVITFVGPAKPTNISARNELIGLISKASNSQTKIEESDRHSNDAIQMNLQREFFEKYGLYYERKRGEFSDGIHSGYINDELIVNREKLIKVGLASEYRVNEARSSVQKIYLGDTLSKTLKTKDVSKYAYGYEILRLIESKLKAKKAPKGDKYNTKISGQALRYGQFAVIATCINFGISSGKDEKTVLESVLSQWQDFESWAAKKASNSTYQSGSSMNFVNYYKGSTINSDLKAYSFKA